MNDKEFNMHYLGVHVESNGKDVTLKALLHPSAQIGTFEWAVQRLMDGYWVKHIRDSVYPELPEPIGEDDYIHVSAIKGKIFSLSRRKMTPQEVKDEMRQYEKWRDGWEISCSPIYCIGEDA